MRTNSKLAIVFLYLGCLKGPSEIRRNTLQLPEKFFLKCLAPGILAKHPDRSPAPRKLEGTLDTIIFNTWP